MNIPDHPEIRCAERTGYPSWLQEPKTPVCPICGAETDTFYKNKDYDIVGCSECIHISDAWDEEVIDRV